MSYSVHEPSHVASGSEVGLFAHLEIVEELIRTIMSETGNHPALGPEPSKITTDWRDDGPEEGEHNGWYTLIEWPVEVKAMGASHRDKLGTMSVKDSGGFAYEGPLDGEPPEDHDHGPILPGDEGGLATRVYTKDGHIVLDFGKDLSWLGLHKAGAEQLIETLQKMVAKL